MSDNKKNAEKGDRSEVGLSDLLCAQKATEHDYPQRVKQRLWGGKFDFSWFHIRKFIYGFGAGFMFTYQANKDNLFGAFFWLILSFYIYLVAKKDEYI